MRNQLAGQFQTVVRRNQHEFDRAERPGDFDGDRIGIQPVGVAIAVKSERGDDGDNAFIEELPEHFAIHLMHLAGVLVVYAFENAKRHGLNGVRLCGPQVVGRKSFQNFVRDPIGAEEGEFQRRRVSHAGAVGIRDGPAEFVGERLDLVAGAMDNDNLNAQTPQHSDIQQEVVEIVVGHHRAVNGDDEHLVAELWNVMQNSAQISWFHIVGALYGTQPAGFNRCFSACVCLRLPAG